MKTLLPNMEDAEAESAPAGDDGTRKTSGEEQVEYQRLWTSLT